MRLLSFVLLSAGAMALAGCSSDEGPIVAPTVPLASTRFVHAMPDTGATDWRFIDQLENSPVALALNFRAASPYQATAPGARPLKVFTTSENIALTQKTFIDSSLTFDSGKRYTLVQVGMARTGQTPAERMLVIEDVFPTVAANQVAIRIINTGAGLGAIDVYAAPAIGAAAAPAAPLVTNLPYLGISPYVLVAATPSTGLSSLAATVTGFSRTTGSFITDGFTVGRQIVGSRFTNAANNTRSVITGVTATTITIGPTTGAITLSAERDTVANTNTYSRTTGSFIADGLASGMRINVAGFDSTRNNGTTLITAITATKLTVDSLTANEVAGANRTITKANVVEAEAPNRLIVGELVLRATATGTATVVAELTPPAGLPAEPLNNLEPVGGTAMPGSVLSAFLMPRSVSGSTATSFSTPNFVYLVDKHPR